MKISIIQTITNILDETRTIQSTNTDENYVIEAEENKVLKNIKTGKLHWSPVCVNHKSKINNYTEVENPNIPEIEYLDSI